MERHFEPGSVVRHFKRDFDKAGTRWLYVYLGTAVHSETSERLAVYRALYGEGILYARPEEAFLECVDKSRHPDAKQAFRFELADADDLNAVKKMAGIEQGRQWNR